MVLCEEEEMQEEREATLETSRPKNRKFECGLRGLDESEESSAIFKVCKWCFV